MPKIKMSKLEYLYYRYPEDTGVPTPESQKLYEFLEKRLGREFVFEVEDYFASAEIESHRNGWISGFSYAMSLMRECVKQ